MSFERLSLKIKSKYDDVGLFPFLARTAEGDNLENIKQIKTDSFELNSFDDISKCQQTDLEEYYLSELLFILKQMEIKAFIENTKELHENVSDDKNKIIIGRGQYSNASFFKANVPNNICISKKMLGIEDHGLLIGDLRGINLGNMGTSNMKSFILVKN